MALLRNQPLLPLTLNIKREKWRDENDPNFAAVDAEFDQVKKRVLERDDYGCRFCSFRVPPSPRGTHWQEVHHLNDDHTDNRPENLVTACQYCHMCQHIGLWGGKREAVLIWLPELTQVELNHTVRMIQVAKAWAGEKRADVARVAPGLKRSAEDVAASATRISDAASAYFSALKDRQNRAQDYFKTSDALDLANVLMLAPDEVFVRKDSWTLGLRLLPLGMRIVENGHDRAQDWLEVWMGKGGPFFNLKPDTWNGLLSIAMKK
jgi:intracellular multiplication protein IcmJ